MPWKPGHYFRVYRDLCVAWGTTGYLYVQERSRPAGHHADIGYAANAAYLRLPDSVDFLVQDHRAQTLWSCDHHVRHCSCGPLDESGYSMVDQSVIEAANAYGLTSRQKLVGVEIPLALPNIMAGVNQTIMMSLAMVVIASLVSAPGLGTLVLDGINNLRLGVGFVAGFAIVLLAILLDRVSKSALDRINAAQAQNS